MNQNNLISGTQNKCYTYKYVNILIALYDEEKAQAFAMLRSTESCLYIATNDFRVTNRTKSRKSR